MSGLGHREAPADDRRDDREDDYERAGLAGNLVPGASPALVLVDPARAYVDPDCPLYAGVEPAVEAMRALLSAARRAVAV